MNKRILLPLILSALYFVLIFLINPAIGVTWDEPTYFSCALSFSEASSFSEAKEVLNCVPEHPHFVKTLGGVSHKLTSSFLDITTSLRFGMFVLAAVFIYLFFISISSLFGGFVALASTLILITMPKVFFHANLLSMDFAVMVFVFLTAMSFYYLLEKGGKKWILLFALSFSFLLINKIMGYAIILPLMLYGSYGLYGKAKISNEKLKEFKPLLLSLTLALVLLFILLFGNLAAFFYPFQSTQFQSGFGDDKVQHTVLLFGKELSSSSLVADIFYVPMHLFTSFNSLLVLMSLLGLILLIKNRKEHSAMPLLIVAFITLYLVFSFVMPKYDNERNFLLLFPFLAIFGGYGAKWIVDKIKSNYSKAIVITLIAILGFTTLYLAHPFYSSYFNAFVGGTGGVANNNIMTVTYWQPELVYTLDFLNSLPEGSSITVPGASEPYIWYQKIGKIRDDIVFQASPPDYLGLVLKQDLFLKFSPEPDRSQRPIDTPWEFYYKTPPQFIAYNVTTKDGVDLVKIYKVKGLFGP